MRGSEVQQKLQESFQNFHTSLQESASAREAQEISAFSIQKSICRAAGRFFSYSGDELMLFVHTFAYNQQLHKGDTQETLSESQIAESNIPTQYN